MQNTLEHYRHFPFPLAHEGRVVWMTPGGAEAPEPEETPKVAETDDEKEANSPKKTDYQLGQKLELGMRNNLALGVDNPQLVKKINDALKEKGMQLRSNFNQEAKSLVAEFADPELQLKLNTEWGKRVTETPAGETEAGEKEPEKVTGDALNQTQLRLVNELGLDAENPVIKKIVEDMAKETTADQLTAAEKNKGKLQLNKAQVDILREHYIKSPHKVDSKVADTFEEFTKGSPNLKDHFDDVDDPALQYIGKRHKVEMGKGTKENPNVLLIDGKPITSPDQLRNYMPPGMEESFDKLAKGQLKDVKDGEQALTKFNELLKNHNEAADQVGKLHELMEDPNVLKETGLLSDLPALINLVMMIKAAIESNPPDLQTLTEAFEDFTAKPRRNPARIMADNRDTYGRILTAQKPPLDKLLNVYMNPRGEDAMKLFSKGNAKSALGGAEGADAKIQQINRYMGPAAKPAIAQYFAKNLGMKISEIRPVEGGTAEIIVYHGNQRKGIQVLSVNDKPTAFVTNYSKNKEGEYEVAGTSEGTEVNTMDDLKRAIQAKSKAKKERAEGKA